MEAGTVAVFLALLAREEHESSWNVEVLAPTLALNESL